MTKGIKEKLKGRQIMEKIGIYKFEEILKKDFLMGTGFTILI